LQQSHTFPPWPGLNGRPACARLSVSEFASFPRPPTGEPGLTLDSIADPVANNPPAWQEARGNAIRSRQSLGE
jgi:hypothetical protein